MTREQKLETLKKIEERQLIWKKINFNVILEPRDKTLSDNDIDQISKKIISAVQESTGATLRS